jgi:hypothetical protein
MASIPPRFIYENARAYFKGELDEKTAHSWEEAVRSDLEYMQKRSSNDDWMYAAPIAVGLFCGLL